MTEIQRYDVGLNGDGDLRTYPIADGEYVRYMDHIERIATLEDERNNARLDAEDKARVARIAIANFEQSEGALDTLRKSDEKQCSQVYFDLIEELGVPPNSSLFDAVMALKKENK